ncbi:uncharacterized protein LOC104430775 isoform X3 [Eucalyptus grandis]|uniref:uncharacterized protein LOC104430775 isoform X3 n=1 Tax=Eucalyptus grandis TaxID=71139 RepID=UPI00192E8541|nr:uncharacterized protein LOC104430775 isoform X3 [Eucalyptus grandis]
MISWKHGISGRTPMRLSSPSIIGERRSLEPIADRRSPVAVLVGAHGNLGFLSVRASIAHRQASEMPAGSTFWTVAWMFGTATMSMGRTMRTLNVEATGCSMGEHFNAS